ncbi:MAG: hypothetical protein QGI05_03415 [Candidatus Omnitrophota bacterium]|jgi:predicted methyltransferase|nr:hypothetical protein [Candidatus Omnitrophota bacterium]
MDKKVVITQFKWAGSLGPIHIKNTCSECDITTAILKNMIEKEFKGKGVALEIKPWLDNLFYCLLRGAWHAPIIMVNGSKFHQFSRKKPLFDRAKLIELVSHLL